MITPSPSLILVPYDFSPTSKAAWLHAVGLSQRTGARIEVCYVHAYVTLEAAYVPPPPRRELTHRLRSELGKAPKLHILEGDPVMRILTLARKLGAGLIVMGTHGRTGLARLQRGSVTEAVARRCAIPLLAVHRPPREIKRVLCPVNFTDYAKAGLLSAAEVASALKVPLAVLNVREAGASGKDARSQADWIVSSLPEPLQAACRPIIELHRGTAVKGILRAAKSRDLVVIVSHRKSLLRDAFKGTTAEQVLRLSPAPVLVLPRI